MTKSEAARHNGALSKGPVTPEGKQRSASNSRKHGIYSRDIVIPGESPEAFEELLNDYIGRCQPVGPVEYDLVLEMAAARWRLRRTHAIEQALYQTEVDRLMSDPDNPMDRTRAFARAGVNLLNGDSLLKIQRIERRLSSAFEKAWKQLENLQDQRRANNYEPEQNEPTELSAQVVELVRNEPSVRERTVSAADGAPLSLPQTASEQTNAAAVSRTAAAR